MVQKKWNWQKEDWPNFYYNSEGIETLEREFFRQSGIAIGVTKYLLDDVHQELIVELVGNEVLQISEIEGEILDRDSLQSSLRKEFGLSLKYHFDAKPAESGIAFVYNIFTFSPGTLRNVLSPVRNCIPSGASSSALAACRASGVLRL